MLVQKQRHYIDFLLVLCCHRPEILLLELFLLLDIVVKLTAEQNRSRVLLDFVDKLHLILYLQTIITRLMILQTIITRLMIFGFE